MCPKRYPANMPRWAPTGLQLGYLLGPSWGPSVFVRCSHVGPNWASLSQLKPSWSPARLQLLKLGSAGLQLGFSWARLAQLGPRWEHMTNTDGPQLGPSK